MPRVISTTLNTVSGTEKFKSETTWSGGGGGISKVWAMPSFQLVNGVSVALANGGSGTFRNVPGFTAGPGYDNVTGFGSIDLGVFLPTVLTKR